MINDLGNLQGLEPRSVELWKAQSEFNADKVVVVIDRANITPAPTAAIWSYVVPFHLAGEISGLTIPYTGTIGAAVSTDSSAGTPAVSDATPDVVMGVGSVTVSGDAAAWLNSEVVTLTLTYTNLRGATDTDTWTVTFTTPA